MIHLDLGSQEDPFPPADVPSSHVGHQLFGKLLVSDRVAIEAQSVAVDFSRNLLVELRDVGGQLLRLSSAQSRKLLQHSSVQHSLLGS